MVEPASLESPVRNHLVTQVCSAMTQWKDSAVAHALVAILVMANAANHVEVAKTIHATQVSSAPMMSTHHTTAVAHVQLALQGMVHLAMT